MTKIQNSKSVLVFEYWNLRFVCNLVLGVWDFIDLYRQSHPTLTPARRDRGLALRTRFSMLNKLTSFKATKNTPLSLASPDIL